MSSPSSRVLVAVRDYVASKQQYDKKWHQDNCPERGDYHRWYADRNRAYEVLQQKFDILAAALRALVASPSPEPLDEAWKAAEAALPDGWVIGHVQRNSQHGHPKGQAWSASCYRETGDPLPLTGHIGKGRWPDRRQIAYGPTPAAALRALAARLSEDPR